MPTACRSRVLSELLPVSSYWCHCSCLSVSKSKKVKQSTYGCARGEKRYTSCSFTTSALEEGEWSASLPGPALPSGKGLPVPIGQEAGWDPEPVWTQRLEERSFCLCRGSNFDRPVVQSVARHYTDWATPASLSVSTGEEYERTQLMGCNLCPIRGVNRIPAPVYSVRHHALSVRTQRLSTVM
jgi:hypothetical protein